MILTVLSLVHQTKFEPQMELVFQAVQETTKFWKMEFVFVRMISNLSKEFVFLPVIQLLNSETRLPVFVKLSVLLTKPELVEPANVLKGLKE